MFRKACVCGLMLAASAPAVAQAGPVAQVSPDQLVCQLSGDCSASGPAATEDKPESRGFSIARHVGAGQPAAPAPAEPTRAAPVRLATPAAHGFAAGPRREALRPAGEVGRASLAINFVIGSAELTDSGRAQAQAVAEALKSPQLAGKRFQIGGHTDAIGSRAYNLDLSQKRAQAVVDYLVTQGASRTQFDVRGYGFDSPLPGIGPRAAGNRRVEVVKLD